LTSWEGVKTRSAVFSPSGVLLAQPVDVTGHQDQIQPAILLPADTRQSPADQQIQTARENRILAPLPLSIAATIVCSLLLAACSRMRRISCFTNARPAYSGNNVDRVLSTGPIAFRARKSDKQLFR
jgi:hypothetical protein